MCFLKDCFHVLSILFMVAMSILSPTLVTKVSFIALLIATMVVIYLVRQPEDGDNSVTFDPRATVSNE